MPLTPHQAHLLIVEDDRGGREFVLDGSIYSIGKDPACDIRLISRFVSRYHATLIKLLNDDSIAYYRIVNGNLKGKRSANGLLINGRRMTAHKLQHKDEIVFGPQVRAVYHWRHQPGQPLPCDEPIPPDLPPNSYTLGRFTLTGPDDCYDPSEE